MADETTNTQGETPESTQGNQADTQKSSTEQMPKFKSLAEKKKYIHDLKKKKELERKAQLKKEREEAKKKAREERKANGGGSKKGLIIALVVLAIVAGGAAYYFTTLDVKPKDIPEPEVVDTTPAVDTVQVQLDALDEKLEKVVEEVKAEPANKWGLSKPCYVISHSSMKSEKFALKTVNKLERAGFKTGYYWIPDLGPGGNEYYKVYVGPFATEQAAIDQLYEVRKHSKLAYIVEMK